MTLSGRLQTETEEKGVLLQLIQQNKQQQDRLTDNNNDIRLKVEHSSDTTTSQE